MISISWPFVLVCLLIELTPGPNMSYLALVSTVHGRRAGLATVVGIALGLLIIGIAAAFGASAIVSESAFLYETLRWGGVLYLLWLSWEAWSDKAAMDSHPEYPQSKFFKNGLVTNILNPKAALFYISTIPIFIDNTKDVLTQNLILTVTFVIIATIIHLSIALLSAKAGTFLANKQRQAALRRIFALLLVGTAVWFALTTAR